MFDGDHPTSSNMIFFFFSSVFFCKFQTSQNASNISSNIQNLRCWMKCWMHLSRPLPFSILLAKNAVLLSILLSYYSGHLSKPQQKNRKREKLTFSGKILCVNKSFSFVNEAGRSLIPRVEDTNSTIGSNVLPWKWMAIKRRVSP